MLPASLKDDTVKMNDRNKHKVMEQMKHQTADPKAKASVFLFFPTAHFLKTNKRSDSRAPLIDKLNKRVILASRTNGTFDFCKYTSQHFKKPKKPFFNQSIKEFQLIIKKNNFKI